MNLLSVPVVVVATVSLGRGTATEAPAAPERAGLVGIVPEVDALVEEEAVGSSIESPGLASICRMNKSRTKIRVELIVQSTHIAVNRKGVVLELSARGSYHVKRVGDMMKN
jgi:hypothetical protein